MRMGVGVGVGVDDEWGSTRSRFEDRKVRVM